MHFLKKIAARLPNRWQNELKRFYFNWQICRNCFAADEPEYEILSRFIKLGDWVIDVGENIGHYTKRFSDLVGSNGRVIAFEPVPATFSLLSANVQLFAFSNVTLINAAVSDRIDMVSMCIPKFSTGLLNYYQAHMTDADTGLSVLTISLDSLCILNRISLVKIDTEGHELFVLNGMQKLLKKHRPVLIVEADSEDIIKKIKSLGYASEELHNSPNVLFQPLPL